MHFTRLISRLVIGLACCTWVVAHAASPVFRTVDENGNVTFSDTPSNNAKVITTEAPNTYQSADTPRPTFDRPMMAEEGADSDDSPVYTALVVITPETDETIRENSGSVLVEARLRPALNAQHHTVLIMDGKHGDKSRTLSFQLQNVDRGTHTAAVAIVDDSGAELIRSTAVTFHLQRVSIR